MTLPKPRGQLSEALIALLPGSSDIEPITTRPDSDEDAALSLWVLYELSYRGYPEVDDRREWDPELVRLRRILEEEFEQRLRDRWPGPPQDDGTGVAERLFAMVDADEGPSLARHIQRDATADQAIELLQCRSLYHLKESDPVSLTLPRLPVGPRSALAELQYDEYGGGRPERLHAHLFARGLESLGLDASEGAFVGQAPVAVLEQNNAMSLFGINRRLRGASVGHLAAFEATSSLPCRKMAQGLERLGFPEEMRAYYEEHVEADAVHEQLAARAICAALIEVEPELEDDVWFGAWACLDLEARTAQHLLERWGAA